jgi:hypothetical protein
MFKLRYCLIGLVEQSQKIPEAPTPLRWRNRTSEAGGKTGVAWWQLAACGG